MDWENLLGYMFSPLFTQHKVAKGQIFTTTLQKDKSYLDRSFSSLNVRSLFSILELTFLSTSQKVSMSMECSGILSKKISNSFTMFVSSWKTSGFWNLLPVPS